EAGFAVDQFGATGNFPSLFRGLQTACRVNDLSGLGAMRLRNSRFENNQIAIHSRGVKAPEISNNTIELTGGNGYIGEGVFLETGTAYAVKGNHISGNENYPTWGVMAWNTGTDPNEVKQNYFYNLTVANIANYVNTNGSVLNPKGLQYLCNYHENNRYDIAALGINTATHGICAEQGSSTVPAGNQFSAAFTNHVDIYNHPSGVGDIDYYYQSGQAPNTTVGNVNSIYSSNTNNCEDRGGTDLPSSVYSSLQHFLYATDEELTYPENRRDSLYYWVRQWNSPYARVMEADMLMEDGNIAAAIATYHNIAGSFEMAEEEASEFAYGKTLLEIRAVLAGEAKTMKELDNTTVDQLTAIAENAKAWAKVRAQNWLTLYDGRQFTNTIL
ncbi:MAG: hypothetical protein JST52_12755, partial [Bacteroidetes bacterium]|nr:hypothetical protein [Bacteroidota bacterium]